MPSGNSQRYYPGQVFTTAGSSPSLGPLYQRGNIIDSTCACGAPATKLFYNPRAVPTPITDHCDFLTLCDACDFRWKVMRAADRVEDFLEDYREKQEARRLLEEKERQESFAEYRRQIQTMQQVKQMQNWQGMQTTQQHPNWQNGLLGHAASGQACTENEQLPVKSPWYKFW